MEFDDLASQYAAVLESIHPLRIPILFHIKLRGIQPHQAAVREDFCKAFRRIASTDMSIRP